jgi:hypothetical protein
MRLTSRRPSAALIVALVALFVAMAGTAAAAVIISSPDQLGDGVVSERAIACAALRVLAPTSSGERRLFAVPDLRVCVDGSASDEETRVCLGHCASLTQRQWTYRPDVVPRHRRYTQGGRRLVALAVGVCLVVVQRLSSRTM